MNVRLAIPVLIPATTPWAPTTAPVPGASPSQLMAGPARVRNTQPRDGPRFKFKSHCSLKSLLSVSDIDECSLGGDVCHDGQDCENTIGSYRCLMRCGRGFRRTADGLSCTGSSADVTENFRKLFSHLSVSKLMCSVFFVAQMWTNVRSPIHVINTVWIPLVATAVPVSQAFNSRTDDA